MKSKNNGYILKLMMTMLLLPLILCTGCEKADALDKTGAPSDHIDRFGEAAMLSVKVEEKLRIDQIEGFTVGQGGCTDGEYAYFVLECNSTTPHMCRVLKIDMVKWKIVKTSEPLAIDHGNDMTYNAKLKQLIAIHNSPNYDTISFIDPKTLTVTDTKKLSIKTYGAAYNEKYDQYCFGISGTYDFAILDADFNVIKRFKGHDSGYIKQGIDCDDKYLYFLQYDQNCIYVYDWEGNINTVISIPVSNKESENLFHIGKTFYIGFNHAGGYIYSAVIGLE